MPMSVFVLVLSCIAIQYYNESYDGAKALQLIFYKFSVMAGTLSHSFLRPKREDVVSHPVNE